jgi:sorting nexin-4
MGEVIINAFVHLKGDEEYLQLKTAIEKCEKNLMKIESLNTNVLKDQQEIAKSFDIVANSIDSLGQMETQMHDALTKVGKQMKNYSESIKAKADKEDLEYVIPIKEYLQYFDSVRDTLKLRDQKRIDVQELEKYLTQYKSERDELFSRGSSGKIGQFFQDRINDLKGVDPEKTRTERLNKLEERVKQLENALAEAKNENEIFGKNVIEEIEFFNKNKVDDFKVLFQIKTGDEIEFHKSSIAFWDNIINILSDSAAEIENTE